MDSYGTAKQKLNEHGQEHLLRFWNELDDEQRAKLLADIERIDFNELDRLIESHVRNQPMVALPGDIRPPEILPNEPADAELAKRYAEARRLGERLISGGRVACLTVAGGQGTRLGFSGPKGALPVSPIKNKPLFQLFAEQIRNAQERWNVSLPWLIMTSPANDQQTREFFESNAHFGLDAGQVLFFTQGLLPAMDFQGKILLTEKGQVALAPNGHGGTLKALYTSGMIERMRSAGVRILSYFQVDNPLIHPVDPLFIGLHEQAHAQVSSKTIPKSGPLEKVGNFCIADGKLTVIEYSDLPDELAHATAADGRRVFDAGSIAIHLFDVQFIAELNRGGFGLPFHRAIKKVAYIDEEGRRIEPAAPNAVKLETFIFDSLPLARKTVVYQTRRDEEFAPVKNASGPDSLETCQAAMSERFARWLESAGVKTPRKPNGGVDAVIEISPLLADWAEQVADAVDPMAVRIPRGGKVYLG